jgi:pimeloyl-ACP methyl ester carboxylesterase
MQPSHMQPSGEIQFQRETIPVNGIRVVMLTAGSGEPLMFWHGAGSWHGWDFAAPWLAHFRVMIPFHPGWGESADAPEMTTADDYALHYLEMIDQLGIDKVNLVGLSMGGRLAATFAIHHRRRVRKLVLVCPAGLIVPEHPMADLSKLPPQEVLRYLAHDFSVIERRLPKGPDPKFFAERDRENGNFGKLMQNGLVGPWLPRWLHRVNVPTMIVWGEQDRLLPPGQADAWKNLIPQAQVRRFANAGHLVLDEAPDSAEAIGQFLR